MKIVQKKIEVTVFADHGNNNVEAAKKKKKHSPRTDCKEGQKIINVTEMNIHAVCQDTRQVILYHDNIF